MARKPLPPDEILTLLSEAPARIAALTGDLSAEQLRTRPAPDEWSLNDILAHLRSCADVWGGCIEAILAEAHPTFRAVDPRTWMESTDYPELAFRPSLRAFTEQRNALVAVLTALPAEGWERGATVTGAGKPLERTTRFYAQWLATHERTHIKQIGRLAKAMAG